MVKKHFLLLKLITVFILYSLYIYIGRNNVQIYFEFQESVDYFSFVKYSKVLMSEAPACKQSSTSNCAKCVSKLVRFMSLLSCSYLLQYLPVTVGKVLEKYCIYCNFNELCLFVNCVYIF